jgi:hypothetical protein
MLFREIIAVYCENRTEHIKRVYGQNAEFYYVKACGTYSDQWALKYSEPEFLSKERGADVGWGVAKLEILSLHTRC